MTDEIMTLKDVSEYLKIAEKTLYGYVQKGLIPGIKIGSAWRFRKSDIDGWLEDQRKLTEASTRGRTVTGKPDEKATPPRTARAQGKHA